MESGTVTKIFGERGFGFIRDKFGDEHFFHASRCGDVFATLEVNDSVTFAFGPGRNGRTCAIDVRPAKHDAPPDAVSAKSLFIKQRSYD
jgi:cold shock CspA family protein